MASRRSPGVAVILLGLIVFTVGSVVLLVVPSWGNWLQGYPQQVLSQPLPPQAQPIVQALMGIVLGPLLQKIGSWIHAIGIFVGTVLLVISLFPLGAGLAILRGWVR